MTTTLESKIERRLLWRVSIFTCLFIFFIVTFFFSLYSGDLKIGTGAIFRAIFIEHEGINHQIIWNIRLPRNLTAALVGICLSLSGAILQGIMRNPLASPSIIGVTSGGGVAAVIIMILLPLYFHLLVPAAFCGALTATAVIYLLSWKHGVQPMRLILAGVAVSSLLGSVISGLMIFFPENIHSVIDFMVGGLAARSWRHVYIIWPYAVAGSILAILNSKRLNILVLGDETATSLGLNVELNRIGFIALSSVLAAASVSVAGLLGFVGLLVPHIMRIILGSDYRFMLPGCILFSAGLLMLCDTIGRIIMAPMELPVGIIMAMLGAPFFLYLLRGKIKYAN